MTGTTPTQKIRYPSPTDKVAAGAAQMQALASDVDDRAQLDAVLQSDETESPSGAPPAGELVTFNGARTLLAGFTWDDVTLVYQGVARTFMVAATVEVETPGGTDSCASLVECRQNYVATAIASSYDRVDVPAHADDAGSTIGRRVTHRLSFPVQLTSGNTLQFVASSNPGGTVGRVSLRVFPIGPEAGA